VWRDKKNNEVKFEVKDKGRYKLQTPISNGLVCNAKLQCTILTHYITLYLNNYLSELIENKNSQNRSNISLILVTSHINADSQMEELLNLLYAEHGFGAIMRISAGMATFL